MSKAAVIYFSAGGKTKKMAELVADMAGLETYEIRAKEPYDEADLNWMNPESRSSIEMHDASSRPEMEALDVDMTKYDTILLGFPVWWYLAPSIIKTFLEAYDLSGKKLFLFGTSGGSRFGEIVKFLTDSVDATTTITEGIIFSDDIDEQALREWVEGLEL